MVEAIAERKTGAESVIWDLSSLYAGADDPALTADMAALEADVEAFAAQYRGHIADLNAPEMLAAVQAIEVLYDRLGRLSTFAYLTYATDTNDPRFGALVQQITEFYARLNQKLLFMELEWSNVADEQAQRLLSDPALAKYRHYLEAERRYQPYHLSEPEEKLLVEKSVTGRSAWTRFFTQLIGALRVDYDGQEITMSEALPKLHEASRETRRKANAAITAALRSRRMELTYIFNVLAADKAADDRLRGYASWVSSRNLSNKAPDEVVEALIQAVTSNYDIVARHYNLKRVLMGYDELTEYDRYAPLPVKDEETFYTWDEARAIVLKAFGAFSPQVAEIAQKFFDNNWIHAPVTPGKRGGAFCSPGVPSHNPYVLVNYTGTANDVMTLAHELGHGIHSYLANENQGLLNADTPLTTAEMASTFGEMLVFTDLMNQEPDPKVRLAMLAQKIEDSFATIFRQVAMNRFEDGLHTARRQEGELTAERISEIWMQTQKAMFQGSVNLGEDYAAWWSYIPHFLNTPGYVYAYAFGELLVMALFRLYQERGEAFVPQYVDVLASGGNNWPEKILAKVDVDLSDPNFWNEGLSILRAMVEQEEALAEEVYPNKF